MFNNHIVCLDSTRIVFEEWVCACKVGQGIEVRVGGVSGEQCIAYEQ